MAIVTTLHSGSVKVTDYRCTAAPDERPITEVHTAHSVSYVRRGGFSYRYRGQTYEMVTGSVLVGRRDDEFMCTHDHHACGDECLSFHLSPEILDSLGRAGVEGCDRIWRSGGVPPLPELVVLGELAQACVGNSSAIGLDEIGLMFSSRFVDVVSGRKSDTVALPQRDRRRAVEAAMWIDANAEYSGHAGRLVRRVPAACSDPCRPPVPTMPATPSGGVKRVVDYALTDACSVKD